jgi:uncharacterized membrane protein
MAALLGIMLVSTILTFLFYLIRGIFRAIVWIIRDLGQSMKQYEHDQESSKAEESELSWREEHLRNRRRYYGHE